MKIRPVRAELLHPSRQTDIMKPAVPFHKPVNVPKLEQESVSQYLCLLLLLPYSSAYPKESLYSLQSKNALCLYYVRPSVTKYQDQIVCGIFMKFSVQILHTKLSSNGFVKTISDIDIWLMHTNCYPPCPNFSAGLGGTEHRRSSLNDWTVGVSFVKSGSVKATFFLTESTKFCLSSLHSVDKIRVRRCSQQPRLMHEYLFCRSRRTDVIFAVGRRWLKPYFPHFLPGFAKITYNKTAYNALQHVRVSLTIEAQKAAFFERT
jgi:hypothetical protein